MWTTARRARRTARRAAARPISHDRAAAADRRHLALVDVGERLARPPAQLARGSCAPRSGPAASPPARRPGSGLPLASARVRQVAEHEHLGVPGTLESGRRARGPARSRSARRARRPARRAHARGPQHRRRSGSARRRSATPAASISVTTLSVQTCTPSARGRARRGSPARASKLGRMRGPASIRITRVELGIDVAEVARQREAAHLADRAGELDAGRAAADDHERQQLLAPLGIASRARRARTRSARGGGSRSPARASSGPGAKRSQSLVAEVGVLRAGRDDHVVVAELAEIADASRRPATSIATPRPGSRARRAAREQAADRRGDLGRARARPSPPGRAAAGTGGGCGGRSA